MVFTVDARDARTVSFERAIAGAGRIRASRAELLGRMASGAESFESLRAAVSEASADASIRSLRVRSVVLVMPGAAGKVATQRLLEGAGIDGDEPLSELTDEQWQRLSATALERAGA